MKNNNITIFMLLWLLLVGSFSYAQGSMTKSIRMAIFLDKGANARPQIIDTFASDRSISVVVVNGEDIRTGCLKNADVLFIPGGSGKKEAFSLGEDGQEEIRRFTHDGGIYIGVCAGCYLASSSRPEYLGLMPLSNVDKQHWRRGKAFIPIKFTKLGMEIFGLKQENADVLYHNGPIFPHDYEHKNEIAPLSYFLGEIVGPEGQVGLMVNSPAMVLTRYGNGLVLGISPHPEASPGLEDIELHAAHWLYNNRNHVKVAAPVSYAPVSSPTPASSVITEQIPTTLPERIYNKAEEIFEHTRNCHYRHLQESVEDQVRKVNGAYEANTDCSGFVSYVINSVSPGHYNVVYQMTGHTYPHARTFVILIGQLRTDISTNGWLRLGSFRNLRRGDLIAWEKHNQYSQSGRSFTRSGHVMIVVDPPGKIVTGTFASRPIRYVEVYVLDSSSVEHFAPQVLPQGAHQNERDGIGKGTIRLMLDNQDNVIGFWQGTFSHGKNKSIEGPSYSKRIGFARLVPLTAAKSN